MEEFTTMAIWILAVFLAVNIAVSFFNNATLNPEFTAHGMNTNFAKPSQYTDANLAAIQASGQQACSLALDKIVDFIPCSIAKVTAPLMGIVNGLWTFATSWVQLIYLIAAPIGMTFFADILVPILGLIQLAAILELMFRFAGIIRGGS